MEEKKARGLGTRKAMEERYKKSSGREKHKKSHGREKHEKSKRHIGWK